MAAAAEPTDVRSRATIRRITEAAYSVIAEQGVLKLSLDAVVKTAGISKGALLYHFGTKSALLQHVLRQSLAEFEDMVIDLRADDTAPGGWARAYLRATLDVRYTGRGAANALYLAPLDRDPDLLAILRETSALWSRRLAEDGLDPVVARIVRTAADGCWWSDIAGTGVFGDDAARQEYVERLIAMTRG